MFAFLEFEWDVPGLEGLDGDVFFEKLHRGDALGLSGQDGEVCGPPFRDTITPWGLTEIGTALGGRRDGGGKET